MRHWTAAFGETRTLAVVGRMLGLITDILDLSKIDAGHVELETIDYAPLDTVREVLDTLLPVAANKETKLRAVVSRDLGDGVGDAFKIKQCLLNLASNAVKFSPGGEVAIYARRKVHEDRAWFVFDVVDNGVGMSPTQIGRLFQAFVQADASVTRRFGGTGLGLTITQRFARLMGGDVTVKSAEGKGSTFTLCVPASVAAPMQLAA